MLSHCPKITEVEGNEEEISNRLQMWTADECAAFGWEAKPIGLDNFVYVPGPTPSFQQNDDGSADLRRAQSEDKL
jgi:hypothetical protein